MRIALNTRIWEQQPMSGIPLYIQRFHDEALAQGADVRCVQVALDHVLGETLALRGRRPPPPLFDLALAELLAYESGAEIFHGPSNLVPLWRRRLPRHVVTVHDLGFLILPPSLNQRRLFNTYYRWAVARSVHAADAVIADSYNTSHDLMRLLGVPAGKIKVVHLGVDERFRRGSDAPRLVAGRYVLSVSTHPRRKNVLRCLEALARQTRDAADVAYVVVGALAEAQRTDLTQVAADLGLSDRLVLFGSASDDELANLYEHAECMLYPSYYEGFGLPVAEAMASGCPVIASRTSSLPEVLGDTTWLVDPYSTAAISTALGEMLTLSHHARDNLVARNRERARRFVWSRTSQQTLEVLLGG